MSIFRKLVSLGYWLLDTEKSLSDFRKKASRKEGGLVVETHSNKLMSPLVITAHVYYSDFATQLIESLKLLPKDTKVFTTTPNSGIKEELEKYLKAAGNPFDVRLTPNIGRNFGPLLVEFSKQLLQEESFIHVHSKKSLHSPEIAEEWLTRNTDLLLSKNGLARISSITDAYPKIGLVYVDASDLLRGMNFRWGRSRRVANQIFAHLPGFDRVKWSGRLTFPAGGMFWVKVNSIRALLELEWKYEMFPAEDDQIDGSLQHVLERVVGQLVARDPYSTAIYFPETQSFVMQ